MVKARPGLEPLLRRPFSVFELFRNPSGSATGFSLLNKRIGMSTNLLYEAGVGHRVAVLGPLGRPFTMVTAPVEAWLVAGGVGLAPFAVLADRLRAAGTSVTLFYGARSRAELFYLDFFTALGVRVVVTTEDGSRGEPGRVTVALEREMAARKPGARVMTYACGPEGMLAATARVAIRHDCPCEVSVERLMGCGMGGCYSCVVPLRGDDGIGHHVRSCLAGPVLDGHRIVWD
jgi:dihydroorotate dehydrogenase electron transfer subunit